MTYEDDIALLAADIRRYCNNDDRIDEALTQLLKLHQAEVDALAFEARALDKVALFDDLATYCELCGQPSLTTWCATCRQESSPTPRYSRETY